ncbi:porin [Massilia sp. R2A-15]|uniref:porin n=1 Tax=Massilia sp. R2A-15 TaxID=3064278 RepID=UPI00273360D1|nr:porin [Massilia sp. R2A-15]WLI91162.1 porin [Massilia sp. R2A-15]
MKQRLIAVAVLATLAQGVHAQTSDDMQQALAQAQKAAADATVAAQQAQQALEQIRASAAAKAHPKAAAADDALSQTPGEGVMLKSGADYVRLYGLLDMSLSRRTNADKAGNTLNDMPIAWFSGNRWGIEGQHVLKDSGGLKAIFKLESEYELPTGNMDSPGVLFNRDAWLGMESDTIGRITLGRQNTLAREFSKIYGDPYGSAGVTMEEGGYSNNNDFKQFIFYSGSATGTRYDKGIVWKKQVGKFMVGLGYQLGGVPGDFDSGTTKSLGLAYNGGKLNIAGFVTSANVNNFRHTSYSVGGNYQFGLLRLNTGYVHYTADQPAAIGNRDDNAYTISARFSPAGRFDYELGWQTMNANNAAVNGSGYVLNAFANTASATRTGTGKRKTLYASSFYRFDKRTELYLAVDRLKTDGTYLAAQANGFKEQNEAAVGMRFKF